MAGDMSVQLTDLTPAEVGAATGVTPELQRVWRRRGQLTSAGRRGKPFSALDAAEIGLRLILSQRGISPSAAVPVGGIVSQAVVWTALLDVDGACEVLGDAGSVKEFTRRYLDDDMFVASLVGLEEQPGIVLLMTDLSQPQLVGGIDQDTDQSLSGVFVNLMSVGRMIGNRLARPLIRVILPNAGEQPVRRLLPSARGE